MLKKIGEMLIVALIVTGVAVAFFKIVGAVPISVTQTQKQSTFDVTGEGKSVVKPDQAEITLGIRSESGSVSTATEQVDRKMKDLVVQLKALGISEDDIKTTDYSVYPSYGPDSRTANQYTVSSNVRVIIKDVSKSGSVVDLVGKLGLEQSGGLMFTLSDSLKDKATKDAREQAISAAKKKADELANLAGMKLGRIVNIQEGSNAFPVPMYAKADAAMSAGRESTPAQVQSGTSDVNVTVTLSYETR